MMKTLLIGLICCLSACSYQYSAQQTKRFSETIGAASRVESIRLREITLSPLDEVCLSRGLFDNSLTAEEEFHQHLSDSLLSSFQYWFVSVQTLSGIESQKSAMRSAHKNRCKLLVYPSLLVRKDKVWSVVEWDADIESWRDIGFDRLQLRLSIWDVNNGELMDMTVLDSRSGWFQIGISHSQDLLTPSINHYLQQIVAVQ